MPMLHLTSHVYPTTGSRTTGSDTPNPWRDAACREYGDDTWYPIISSQTSPVKAAANIRRAKAVCHECPIRTACLTVALENGEQFGIWGGLTEDERAALSKVGTLNAGVPA